MAIEDLKEHQFKEGESGNPNGRPKGVKNRSTILKKWLEIKTTFKNPETKQDEDGTVEDKIALALITKAIKGDVSAIKEIQDSVYGKNPDVVHTQTLEPITGINIVSDDSTVSTTG